MRSCRALGACLMTHLTIACGPTLEPREHLSEWANDEAAVALAWGLTPDPPLSRLARTLLDASSGAMRTPVDLDVWATHAGHVGPLPSLQWRAVDLPCAPGTCGHAVEAWSRIPPPHAPDVAVGLAITSTAGQAILLRIEAPRTIALEPWPHHRPIGQDAVLRGALAPGLRHPTLLLGSGDDGPVLELPIDVEPHTAGLGIRAVVPCAAPGPAWLELLAEGESGPMVVFNVRQTCGEIPPPAPPSWTVAEIDLDAGRAEAQLWAAANRSRARVGLSPLRRNPRVDRVARGHSQTMADRLVLAHLGPRGDGPRERMEVERLGFAAVLENVAVGPNAALIHAALMRSPAHRRNILAPEVTEIGVGVVVTEGLWVTENFVRSSDG